MHDLLLKHQDALGLGDLVRYADQLGLDVERFKDYLRKHAGARQIAEDVESADLSGVSGTPTFFINGRRHYGAYDIDAPSAAVRAAGARATRRRRGRLSVARPPDSPSLVPSESPERRDKGSPRPPRAASHD
jgi:glutaredoxin